ncbi:hypothetical protein HDU93_003323 [Gonapodya sp. JEL0774]|nr:hypothetical protein HDU93_003323 [Gonapodya sp. JEL0774]
MEAALKLDCCVVGIARSKPDERLARLLETYKNVSMFVQGDVCDQEVQARAVNAAVGKFGGLDAVLHNAAVLDPLSPIDTSSDVEWKRSFDINFHSAVALTKVALPHLRESTKRRGELAKLIFVSSGAAEHAYYSWGAYCTSKAALHMFAKVVAKEEEGVIVSASVKPGVVDTAMQTTIRTTGSTVMRSQDHASFVARYEKGELNDPDTVGYVLARLSISCPASLSGEIFTWNDATVAEFQAPQQ